MSSIESVSVAIYCRISLDAAETAAGVERQLEACRELASGDVVEYVDNSISAYSGAVRPEFERLLTDLSNGRHDTLVCWHVDRLYRSLPDLERIIDAIGTTKVVTVNSGDLDLSTSAGRMVARILGSVSRQESEHHAERRRAANHKRRLAGKWRKEGSRPFGFNGDGTHRQPEAEMIHDATRDILAGVSVHAIARRWNASGVQTVRGKPWSNLHVRRVLSNPRLAALIVHKGEEVGVGEWVPIVDVTLWRALQALFAGRAHALAFERRHLLSGVALCGTCGKPLYASYAHGRERPATYVCRDSHVGRSAPPLDKMIETLMVEYLSTQGVEGELDADTGELEERRAALLTTRKQLSGLLLKGLLTEEDVANEALSIKREIEQIDLQLADRKPVLEGSLMERWASAGVEGRSALIDMLLWIVVYPSGPTRGFDPSLVWSRFR